MIEVVKVQAKKARPSGVQYFVTIPSEFAKALELKKGERLVVRLLELEIEGAKRKVLVYYRVGDIG